MPGYDGTGPQGFGPMTGRGMGACGRGYGRRYGYGSGAGRGFGRGFGFFRGLGRRFGFFQDSPYNEPVQLSKAEKKRILKEELKGLEDEKNEIEKELNNLN